MPNQAEDNQEKTVREKSDNANGTKETGKTDGNNGGDDTRVDPLGFPPDEAIEGMSDDDLKPDNKDLLVHTTLADKYKVLSIIGHGGMGFVYKARHVLLDTTVAVKVLEPFLSRDEKAIKRFHQEARASSKLKHPNVVSVTDFGVTPHGRSYMVMEFIEGTSVAELIQEKGSLPAEQALDIMIQTCEGLLAAHESGIIHRDLKPSNLMITRDKRGKDIVKIVDFGIAKLLPTESEEIQQLTQTGEFFGSPPYMSPEQVKAEKVDHRSDIYSMGCVLNEMLTGSPPFTSDTMNMMEVLYKHISDQPQGLGDSVKDAALKDRLEAIIYRSLEKRPEDRYQTMEEFLADLEEVQKGESKRLTSRLKSFWQLIWLKHLPKHQRPIWRTVMILMVIMMGVAWGTQYTLLRPPDVKLPEVTWKIDDKDAAPTLSKEVANKQIEVLTNELKSPTEGAVPAAIEGGEKLGDLCFNSGQYADAARWYFSAVKLREENMTGDKAGIARDYIRLGDCNYLLRDYERAIEHYKYGINLLKSNSITSPGLARACYRLATAYEDKFEYEQAENYYKLAIDYYRNGSDGSVMEIRPQQALAMSRLAHVMAFQYNAVKNDGNHKKDIQRLEKEVRDAKEKIKQLEKQGLPGSNSELEQTRQDLATSETALREAKTKVLEHYQNAVSAYEAAMKEWHWLGDYRNYAVTSYHLGWLHEEERSLDEAAKCYKYCLYTFPSVLASEDDPYIAATSDAYSRVLRMQGKWIKWLQTKIKANQLKRAYKKKLEFTAR